jgi:hypothetical protein
MQVKTAIVLLSVFVFISVVDLIRKQKMTFKDSMFWLAVSVIAVVLAWNDRMLQSLATWVGFALPSNFIFFLLLIFFLFQSLFLTIYVNEQNNRTESLAQAIGILQYEVQRLKSSKSPAQPNVDSQDR